MADSKSTIAHQWFDEVWNRRNAAAIDKYLTPDSVSHGLVDPGQGPVRGPDSFRSFHRSLLQAFPDLHIIVEDTVSEGDRIACRCRVTGTHSGEGLGLPPSGRAVDFTGMMFMRVRDGKLVEAWNNFDFDRMRAQLTGGAAA